MPGAKHWVFTLNNYTDDEEQFIGDFGESELTGYLVVGRELGANGTPHLQGYFILSERHTLAWIRTTCPGLVRAHLEVSRGTPQQAADYCKKDGDYDEHGECPAGAAGRRSDIDRYRAWIEEQEERPTEREIARAFPSLYLRYKRRLLELAAHLRPEPELVPANAVFRPWQHELRLQLGQEPDDRSIRFIVDEEGNKGKSFFTRWFYSHMEGVQVLGPGKRDDLAHIIDETNHIFLFNIPRGSMEHLHYGLLESIKDRMIISPKYESTLKVLDHKAHVVVFCNEMPDMEKMSADRYIITEI